MLVFFFSLQCRAQMQKASLQFPSEYCSVFTLMFGNAQFDQFYIQIVIFSSEYHKSSPFALLLYISHYNSRKCWAAHCFMRSIRSKFWLHKVTLVVSNLYCGPFSNNCCCQYQSAFICPNCDLKWKSVLPSATISDKSSHLCILDQFYDVLVETATSLNSISESPVRVPDLIALDSGHTKIIVSKLVLNFRHGVFFSQVKQKFKSFLETLGPNLLLSRGKARGSREATT